jgi:hypothetical protein
LQRLINILADNKLIKRKLIENNETKYFYALDKVRYEQLIEKGRAQEYESTQGRKPPPVELRPEVK